MNGIFCSLRCQDWYDAGNAPIEHDRIAKAYKAPIERWRVVAGPPGVEIGARSYQRLEPFLATTGIAASEIRTATREPGFLAGVLEHMLGDESLLIAFADSAGIDPAAVARARSALDRQAKRDPP